MLWIDKKTPSFAKGTRQSFINNATSRRRQRTPVDRRLTPGEITWTTGGVARKQTAIIIPKRAVRAQTEDLAACCCNGLGGDIRGNVESGADGQVFTVEGGARVCYEEIEG